MMKKQLRKKIEKPASAYQLAFRLRKQRIINSKAQRETKTDAQTEDGKRPMVATIVNMNNRTNKYSRQASHHRSHETIKILKR